MELSAKNKEIESLRAFAILLVIIRHLHYSLPISVSDYPTILQGTWAGVDLFFVISGYVITRSLMNSVNGWQQQRISYWQAIKQFYIRRIFRLLPAGYLVMVLFLLGCIFLPGPGSFPGFKEAIHEVPYILLYVYNLAIPYIHQSDFGWYWSLSVEEQFYLFYPLLLFALARFRHTVVLFIGIVLFINIVVRPVYATLIHEVHLWPYYTTPTFLRIDLLLSGCAIALMHRKITLPGKWWHIIIVVISVVMVGSVGGWIPSPHIYAYPIILVFSVVLVQLAAQQQGVIPVNNWLQWTGARSYILYLINIPVIYLVNGVYSRFMGSTVKAASLPAGLVCLGISLVMMVVLANVLHRWVEQPCIRWGKQLSGQA